MSSVTVPKSLPEPQSPESFVTVRGFYTGTMLVPNKMLIEGLQGSCLGTSWRFFIKHAPSQTKLWFDMGISNDLESDYPTRIQHVQHQVFKAAPAPNSPYDDMKEMRENPSDVNYVIASHAHWDHMFPLGKYFPQATVLCGAGTLELTNDTWPKNPDSGWDGRIWDRSEAQLPVEELPSPNAHPDLWKQLGPFERAHDFFGDQSFWIVDAPGHIPGNLAALCRVKAKDGSVRWIFLGGDCAHCHHFIHYPDAPFGGDATANLHEDPDAARRTIHQMADLRKNYPGVHIWLAHTDSLEAEWELP